MNATSSNMKVCYQEQNNKFPGSISVHLSPCTLLTGECDAPIVISSHLPATATTTTGTAVVAILTNSSTTPIIAPATNPYTLVGKGDDLEVVLLNLVTDYSSRKVNQDNHKKICDLRQPYSKEI